MLVPKTALRRCSTRPRSDDVVENLKAVYFMGVMGLPILGAVGGTVAGTVMSDERSRSKRVMEGVSIGFLGACVGWLVGVSWPAWVPFAALSYVVDKVCN